MAGETGRVIHFGSLLVDGVMFRQIRCFVNIPRVRHPAGAAFQRGWGFCRIQPSTQVLRTCPGGEIGRRKGLKIPRGQPRAGSIPALGTIFSLAGPRIRPVFASLLSPVAALGLRVQFAGLVGHVADFAVGRIGGLFDEAGAQLLVVQQVVKLDGRGGDAGGILQFPEDGNEFVLLLLVHHLLLFLEISRVDSGA